VVWVLVRWAVVATGVSARVGCGCRSSAVCERGRRGAGGDRPNSKSARRRGDTGVRADLRLGDEGSRPGGIVGVVDVAALLD
jgi:hypothetical protein